MSHLADDYSMSIEDAQELLGTVCLPFDIRQKLIGRYYKEHGLLALVNLFAQFIGMANSVVVNNREMAELILISQGGMWPQEAERANLPTIFGALNGVLLASKVDQGKMCEGCAFRLGTPANQSPITAIDAGHCLSEGVNFLCHDVEDGQPKRLCRGFARARKMREVING